MKRHSRCRARVRAVSFAFARSARLPELEYWPPSRVLKNRPRKRRFAPLRLVRLIIQAVKPPD